MAEGVFEHDDAVDVLGPPGTTMIFHSRLVHHSPPNETNDPRRVLIYSYYPSTFSIEYDVRNRPRRLAAADLERQYKMRKERGEYVDTFVAPGLSGVE